MGNEMIASYVGRWSQAQLEQLQLCEHIDQISRRLPVHDVEAFDQIASRLDAVLSRLHGFEEEELFPMLEAMSPPMRPLLITFRSHHARDRMEANALIRCLRDPSQLTADGLRVLKLQLEAFTEALRRHVQFEEAIAMALFASKRVDEKRAVQ